MNSPFTTYNTQQIQRTKKEANREDWLRFRREAGLGASEIAGILGLAPWKNKTPLSVYLDKIGEGTPCETSLAMAVGTELEDLVAREFTKKTGLEVRNFNTTLVDPVNHIVGDVDRLVVPQGEAVASVGMYPRTDALLECKTHGGEIWDEVPAEYLSQVQTYMWLTGCTRAYVACLFFLPFGGKAVEVYTVERDDATIEAIKACAKSFWENNVLKRVAPLATSNEEVARKDRKSVV